MAELSAAELNLVQTLVSKVQEKGKIGIIPILKACQLMRDPSQIMMYIYPE